MTEANFISKNEDKWKTLEQFNRKIKGKIHNLHQDEVEDFAHHFRLASHHLAYARTHFPNSHIIPYLNKVVGASHNYFYVRKSRAISDMRSYFSTTFPRAVRESFRYWGVATAFFMLGIVFAWFYVSGDLHRLQEITPAWVGGGFDPYEVPELPDGSHQWEHSFMATIITTNNIRVTFNAIVGGLLAGLGTIFILIYNGIIIGGLFGFLNTAGADMLVAHSLVWPHGVIELVAIFFAGGCGLMLAKGLLLPGDLTRRQSLVDQCKKAAQLLPGIVALLVIAGIIEGYFTPLDVDPRLKLVFAGLTGASLFAYFTKGAKGDDSATKL